jgi:hypothetical protein
MVTRYIAGIDVAYIWDMTRLDQGEGMNLSLNECSREQLEKEASNSQSLQLPPKY